MKKILRKIANPIRSTVAQLFCLTEPEKLKAFLPNSAGNYYLLNRLTQQSINQTFPALARLTRQISNKEIQTLTVDEFCSLHNENESKSKSLYQLFNNYGSDKASTHDYYRLYSVVLNEPNNITGIFEIGLGTNNTDVPSNMGAQGKPGASLRAFRDYCPEAEIIGADVDKRVLFEEERIKTYFVDQTDYNTLNNLKDKIAKVDLFIDDGLHSPNANIASLSLALECVKQNGWIIIEDILESAVPVWEVISGMLDDTIYESYIVKSKSAYMFLVKKLS